MFISRCSAGVLGGRLLSSQGRVASALPALTCLRRFQSSTAEGTSSTSGISSSGTVPGTAVALGSAQGGRVPIHYSPGSGVGGPGLAVPATVITEHCDIISDTFSKADELLLQRRAQSAAVASGAAAAAEAAILSDEGIGEMLEELQEATRAEVDALVADVRGGPVLSQAGMHELRRTLYYASALRAREWIDAAPYTVLMRALTVELLRRESDGVLAPDDVLYVTTHMVAASYYNRHLWERMERAMEKYSNFDHIDLPTIKALTTRLFKTRRGCPRETLNVRRKILAAMTRRVGLLANEFDLPSLLGILQCYSVHDMVPPSLQPLAIRAANHVGEFTPHECATLAHILRKHRILRLEICERLVERICTADQLNHHMANSALIAIRACFNQVSDGGRNALHAEPTRQKLRAMGEQVGCRLGEVEFPALPVILSVLDIVVTLKIYVPKKSLTVVFGQADAMLRTTLEPPPQDPADPGAAGRRARATTMEEGRQLQALLLHYGADLCPELGARLKAAFREGLLPDEASV